MATIKRDERSYARFAAYARECGLADVLRGICAAHHASLADAYLDARGPTAHAARLECWWWLTTRRKSPHEIARMFDRDRSSIHYALDRLREEAEGRGVAVAPDTVRVLAAAVAQRAAERKSANGRRQAAINGSGGRRTTARAPEAAQEAPAALGPAGGPSEPETRS